MGHNLIKCSEVWEPVWQGHVLWSIILNLCRQDLNFPCPVTTVDNFRFICIRLVSLSFIVGKQVFIKAPLFVLSHSLCHSLSPSLSLSLSLISLLPSRPPALSLYLSFSLCRSYKGHVNKSESLLSSISIFQTSHIFTAITPRQSQIHLLPHPCHT